MEILESIVTGIAYLVLAAIVLFWVFIMFELFLIIFIFCIEIMVYFFVVGAVLSILLSPIIFIGWIIKSLFG